MHRPPLLLVLLGCACARVPASDGAAQAPPTVQAPATLVARGVTTSERDHAESESPRAGAADTGRDIRRLPTFDDLRYAEVVRQDLERELAGRTAEHPEFATLAFRLALHLQAMAEAERDMEPVTANTHENRASDLLLRLATEPALARFKSMDEVLFMLAVLQRPKNPQDAAKTMRKLIMDHPASTFVGAAYLAFGRHYLDKNELIPAIRLFEKAAQMGGPDQAYAWVMMGKVNLETLDQSGRPSFAKALHAFSKAWAASTDIRAVRSAQDAELVRRESATGLVEAYVHAGAPAKAGDFFHRTVGGKWEVGVLEQLRDRYTAVGNPGAAKQVCAAIRKQMPSHGCRP